MWKACLSEAEVADILKKHYVVVSDPFGAQNGTSFGVRIWMLNPEGKELRKYWYGTGNCLISGVFTDEYHRKRVSEVAQALTEARQIAAGEIKGAADHSGTVLAVDAEKGTVTVRVGVGVNAKEEEFQVAAETKVTNGVNVLKQVTPLADGLKAPLCKRGATATVSTITDKDGNLKVQEVRITGRDRFLK